MAQRQETIHRLRHEFAERWTQLFPRTPIPPVRALNALGSTENSDVSVDEWLETGAVLQLKNALQSTDEKIAQLKDQLARKAHLREFLLKLLECVDSDHTVYGSGASPVNDITLSALDLNVKALPPPSCGVNVVTDVRDCCPSSAHIPPAAGVSGGVNDSQQSCSISVPSPPSLRCENSPTTGAEKFEQKTGLLQSSENEGVSCSDGDYSKGNRSGKFEGEVAAVTSFCPHPKTERHSLRSGQNTARCTPCGAATRDTLQHVEVVQQHSSATHEAKERAVKQYNGQCAPQDKSDQDFDTYSSLDIHDKDFRSQEHIRTTKTGGKDALERPTCHSQQGVAFSSLVADQNTQQCLAGENRSVKSVSSAATQTETSFSVKEQWGLHSTDARDSMFWNRKKPSSGKRRDDSRERDNSGVLGKYSDVEVDLPTPPPLRRNSPRNVQYLKLTDGFNIVLGADSGTPDAAQQYEVRSDSGDSLDEEVYDNNSRGKAGAKSDLPNSDSPRRGSGGVERLRSSPLAIIRPSRPAPSPPTPPRRHLPVGRVCSDTAMLQTDSEKGDSALPGRLSRPQTQPRKKLPPLPMKQKPSAMSRLETATGGNAFNSILPPGNRDSLGARRASTENRTASRDRAEDKAGGRGESHDETSTCMDSGRGTSVPRAAAEHTSVLTDEGAHKALSASANRSSLQRDSPQEDQSVPTTTAPGQTETETNDSDTTTSTSTNAARERPASYHHQQHKQDDVPSSIQQPDAVFSHHSSCPMSARFTYNLDSEPGVRELCQASAIQAVEINQRIGAIASSETEYAARSEDAAVLLRLSRHAECSYAEARSSNEQPTVHTKTNYTPQSRDTQISSPSPEDGTQTQARKSGSYTGADPTMETSLPHPETDEDASTRPSSIVRRERKPPVKPSREKRQKEHHYENWTLDRAITTQILDFNSDEDEDEDDDSDGSSPAGTLEKFPSKGSKDSGLCVDVQAPVVPESVAGSVVLPGSVVNRQLTSRLNEGRISSIEELNRLMDEDDYVNVAGLTQGDATDQDDNISIASDIVFIPGTQVTDSPDTERRSPGHLDTNPHGNQIPSFASDEEHDSSPSVDSSYDDADGLETPLPPSPRDNMLKMRQLLVTGVLETERSYLAILELLLHYKRILEASCKTSQPVISEDDITSIFSNLQQLQDIHKEFVEGLQEKVDHWSPEQTIGNIFKCLVVMFPEFGKYASNYQTAVATIHRCSQESQRFQELAQQIVVRSTRKEVTSLEDALFKPVQRLQRNTLVLHDLIKHTPEDHPDYDTLQKALTLSQHNLENFGTSLMPGHTKVEEKRNLVKSSFLVELVSGWRKLRFIFLFSDLLVCTKREQHRGGKVTFACKWFIPMNVLRLDTKFAYQDDMKFSKKDEIDELKRKLRSMKTELKKEVKKEESKDKHWSISGIATSRTVEKLKKKIHELEGELILASPRLPFKVWLDSGKVHTLLMTTDYEREEWREVITSLRRKSTRVDSASPSAYEVQEMVNSVKELPQVNKIGCMLTETDEDAIYGTLNVTIHKMNGLQDPCDTYCCLEMDSYGHFFMKARTHICSNTMEPSWNEDFELELEGSQTLRILCYRKLPEKQGDILLGRGALEMSKEWLKATFQEKTVAMNEYSLVLSVRYTAAEKTMRRTPSRQSTAVFGVKISTCARREGKTVPTIVTACVQEVERRGMDEKGIYRVSGVTSDVQKLKKHFDKNVKVGANSLGDVDINSVTGVLKLYLRELPEPLFTEASYTNFVDALRLSDAEGKEKCMLSLLHNLPDINYYTAVYLLEHLLKVSRDEKDNKMTIHNLSTIFGPTLLAPAAKTTGASMSEMISMGAEQCMKQSAVVYFFLSVLTKGGNLRRSSVPT